ncbi:MAG: hypothetical protein HC836_48665 [Richelia sp. RM2_1_2]|nr:hypothetical protein [Richelia sp. RM2_1_2]
MRSYKDPSQFFNEMKKKPALQEILDNLNRYSEEDLANIVGQPKWIRDQLIKRKRGEIDTRPESAKVAEAERIADLMIERTKNNVD